MSWKDILKSPRPNPFPGKRKQMEQDSFDNLYPNEQLNRHAVKQLFEKIIDPGLERAIGRNQSNFALGNRPTRVNSEMTVHMMRNEGKFK